GHRDIRSISHGDLYSQDTGIWRRSDRRRAAIAFYPSRHGFGYALQSLLPLEEYRRHFRTQPSWLRRTKRPDYLREGCVRELSAWNVSAARQEHGLRG